MSEYKLHIKTIHQDLYANHKAAYTGDAGIDLYFPENITLPGNSTTLVDLQIQCEMVAITKTFNLDSKALFINKSYLLVPRSSISKTPLRMANSIGIIDSGYRGNIKVAIDNTKQSQYNIERGQRLFQIISPDLNSIKIKLVENLSGTERNSGGFGSSGANTLPTDT